MVITVGPELEAALNDRAHREGVTPEALALRALRERFLTPVSVSPSQGNWEQRLRSAATNCGISLSNEAVSSEGLYD